MAYKLNPKSALFMEGPARHQWAQSIRPGFGVDSLGQAVTRSTTRISLTFRTIKTMEAVPAKPRMVSQIQAHRLCKAPAQSRPPRLPPDPDLKRHKDKEASQSRDRRVGGKVILPRPKSQRVINRQEGLVRLKDLDTQITFNSQEVLVAGVPIVKVEGDGPELLQRRAR